jgi:hypothetical protein
MLPITEVREANEIYYQASRSFHAKRHGNILSTFVFAPDNPSNRHRQG